MSAGYLRKCARKRRHATQAEAEKHRRELVRLGSPLRKTNTYFCIQCLSWHVGHIGEKNRGRR